MTQISIIVPAYNARACIGDCLDALIAQKGLTEPPEILVVDDGSTDGTPEIVEHYASAGVRLLCQRNAGPGPARNAGIRASSGEFLLFTDADCVPDSHWAAEIVRGFTTREIAMVMGATTTSLGFSNIYAKAQQGRDFIDVQPGPTTRYNSNNLALRREIALAFPFDLALPRAEDSDQGWRLLEAGYQTVYWPTARVSHRHPYETRSFFRNAWAEGEGSARLHYKHGQWVPRDLAPFVAAVGALLLAPFWGGFLWLAAFCFVLFLGALMFNELYFKHKPLGLAIQVYPVQFAWYLVKIGGYFRMIGCILLGQEPAIRVSKQAWYAERRRLREAKRDR
jgi:glycosyltransferase involved in cell wall biosynthesis